MAFHYTTETTKILSENNPTNIDNINKIGSAINVNNKTQLEKNVDKVLANNTGLGSNSNNSSTENPNIGTTETSASSETVSATAKTSGFKGIPWDFRVSGSLGEQGIQIGSDMPTGETWKGSYSIMNPYAIIRFGHIAGSNHGIDMIDESGNSNFRAAGNVSVQANFSNDDIQKQNITSDSGSPVTLTETTDVDGKPIASSKTDESYRSITREQAKGLLGDSASNISQYTDSEDSFYLDEMNNLWVLDVDLNTEIWTPSNKSSLKNYSNDSNQPWELQVASGAAADKRPDSKEFWLDYFDFVKCDFLSGANPKLKAALAAEGSSGYTAKGICNVLKKASEDNQTLQQKDIDQNAAEIRKASAQINANISANWSKSGYSKEMKKIQLASSTDKDGNATSTGFSSVEIEPSEDNLCNADNWQNDPQFLYEWTDFLFAKEYGYIPNNRLITLRRFPVPVYDHARIPTQDDSGKFQSPIATAITWIGADGQNKLESLSSMKWSYPWKTLTSQVEELAGNEQGLEESGLDGGRMGTMWKVLGIATGEANFDSISGKADQMSKFDPYKNGPYANLPYGPVNSIQKTLVRDDGGLGFEQDIQLTFTYDLRMIGGINPKAALLDCIANFLILTSNNAPFWGGAVRYFPNKPQYPFPGSKNGMKAWYNGDVSGFVNSIGDQMVSALSNFGSMLKDLFTNPVGALKSLATQGSQLWMAKKQKGHRPAMLATKGLLTGEPVGEWHLMVGNPFNPIMMIGNLVVTDTEMTLADTLGADDFPEWVKFKVVLKHGRPRDKGDIESIFNRGQGRLHYSFPSKSGVVDYNREYNNKNSLVGSQGGSVNKQTQNNTAKSYVQAGKTIKQTNSQKQSSRKSSYSHSFSGTSVVDAVCYSSKRTLKGLYKNASFVAGRIGLENATDAIKSKLNS